MNEKRGWVADFARGCGLRLLLLIFLIAGFYIVFCLRSPFPTLLLFANGAEVAAPVAGFFMWFAVLFMLHARQNERDVALMTQTYRDGERALVVGTVKPEGPLLTSPFSGEECVGYYYNVTHLSSTGSRSVRWTDYEGYAMTPFAIRGPLGDVKVLAEADKELFYELPRQNLGDAYGRADAYLKSADFGEVVVSALGGTSRKRKTVNGPSDFRADNSIGDPPKDLRTHSLVEKVIRAWESVYIVGIYSAERNGVFADPNIMNTPFHVVRGDEKTLRRKTRVRLTGALICACLSLVVVAFYFLVYAPNNPGRANW
jgi:hypothetical protein